jgi:hypothetical protein
VDCRLLLKHVKDSPFAAINREHGADHPPPRRSEQGHTCSTCGKFYRCYDHFRAHVFLEHRVTLPGLEEYKCSVCDKVFYVKQRYEVHMGKHGVPKYSCQDCGYKTHFSSSLSAHKRKAHKKPTGSMLNGKDVFSGS